MQVNSKLEQKVSLQWIHIEYDPALTTQDKLIQDFKETKFDATLFGIDADNCRLLFQPGKSLIPDNPYPAGYAILDTPERMT